MLSFHTISMLIIHACSAQSIRPILAAIMFLIKSISPHAATDLSDFSIRNEGLGAVATSVISYSCSLVVFETNVVVLFTCNSICFCGMLYWEPRVRFWLSLSLVVLVDIQGICYFSILSAVMFVQFCL